MEREKVRQDIVRTEPTNHSREIMAREIGLSSSEKPPSIWSCSLYAWRKIFGRTGAPLENGPISLNRSLAFEGNFRYTKSTVTLSTNARPYSSMQRTFSFSSIFRRKRYHSNRLSMVLALFLLFRCWNFLQSFFSFQFIVEIPHLAASWHWFPLRCWNSFL